MTKSEAIHKWMSSHGMDAYPSNAVPDDAQLPYLTYIKGFSPEGYATTVHLYFRTSSEAVPDAKVEGICETLRYGGLQLPVDNGTLFLTLDNPEWYSMTDDADPDIKHRIININVCDFTHF